MVTLERLDCKSNGFASPGHFSLYSRREFIRLLGLGSLLVYTSGSTPQLDISFIGLDDKDINRSLGIWSEKQVEVLARKMLDDSKLDQIALSGQVLLDNQQGRPSLSRLSPVFLDNKIRVNTIENIIHDTKNSTLPPTGGDKGPIAEAVVDLNDLKNDITIHLEDKSTLLLPTYSLTFRELQLNFSYIKDDSDLAIQFFVAKEILNVKAFDLVSNYMARYKSNPANELTQDLQNSPVVRSAIMLNSELNTVPAPALMDLWAHYLLIPNYLVALDQGKLLSYKNDNHNDSRDEFGLIESSGEYFKSEGILIKNSQGIYEWIDDSTKLQDAWKDFSVYTYLQLKQR